MTHNKPQQQPTSSDSWRQDVERLSMPMGAEELAIRQHRASLIQAIRENPTDNQLRRDYADYVERKPLHTADPARATLIRLQIDRGDGPVSAEEADLFRKFEKAWLSALGSVTAAEWDRGFIIGVRATPQQFLDSAGKLHREPIARLYNPLVGGAEGQYQEDLWALVQDSTFKSTITRLQFVMGDFDTMRPLLASVSDRATLKEVHFKNFTDSREVLLPTGNKYLDESRHTSRVREYSGIDGRRDSLIFGETVISFATFEEGAQYRFGSQQSAIKAG